MATFRTEKLTEDKLYEKLKEISMNLRKLFPRRSLDFFIDGNNTYSNISKGRFGTNQFETFVLGCDDQFWILVPYVGGKWYDGEDVKHNFPEIPAEEVPERLLEALRSASSEYGIDHVADPEYKAYKWLKGQLESV